MFNLFSTGLSGLRAAQGSLATTGHNIANVNTPGFNRQQALLAAREGQSLGGLVVGDGVEVQDIRRIYDRFVNAQVHENTAGLNRLQTFNGLAQQIDNLIADPDAGMSAALQNFFDALHALSNDPASGASREVLLGEARGLIDRFGGVDGRLGDLSDEVDGRLRASVAEINSLASAIADVNGAVTQAGISGSSVNDLLDQRDELIRQLNEHVAVTTTSQQDGSLNVFVGNGLALVLGERAEQLGTIGSPHDPTRLEVSLSSPAGPIRITHNLHGGTIGGALDFRREVLDPTRNSLGRIAVGIVEQFNTTHRNGMDLAGTLGGDFFAIGAPEALPAASNAGTASASTSIDDLAALAADDYLLTYDGAIWQAVSVESGASVPVTGSGSTADPLRFGGVAVEIAGAAAAGDNFLIRPTAAAVPGLELLVRDGQAIAAAAPIQSSAEAANTGNAGISAGRVVDVSDPNLLVPVSIEFVDPSNFTLNGSGPFAYTSGDPITFNGWEVTIDGAAQAGDIFTVTSNAGGAGDNRNALELATLGTRALLDQGNTSVSQSHDTLVASIGTVTRQSSLGLEAQTALLDQSEQTRLAISGVNLDEEAANLVRFEQAYQASAQILAVAERLFQNILSVIGR